jgi:nitrogen fixation protein NifU and related proteins
MANALQGKSVVEALEIIENFRSMIKGEAELPKEFKKLNLLKGVSNFPLRIKCANLGWHTLKAALESYSSIQPSAITPS